MSELFQSFWQGGFESSCHITRAGTRLDMLAATQHDAQADDDYARLRSVGLRTARDGVRWHLIDRGGGRYDFSSLAPMAEAARRHNVQIVWDLCHYGWPDDVDVFAPDFIARFARFCRAVASFLADHSSAVPFYVPVNEISFLTIGASDEAIIHPFAHGRSVEIKRQLVRAAIAGMEAVWSVDGRARFVHAEPLIHVVAPRDRPHLADEARAYRESQFEAWDMIAGRTDPELGGDARFLDIVGVNFYHSGQWELDGERLHWHIHPRDERWSPLSHLLQEVWERYRRPLVVSETSHFGAGRARWLREIAGEARRALDWGVTLEGVCLYPILDRPDWDIPGHWHNSGLWDLLPESDGTLRRVLHAEYAAELHQAQRLVGGAERRLRAA